MEVLQKVIIVDRFSKSKTSSHSNSVRKIHAKLTQSIHSMKINAIATANSKVLRYVGVVDIKEPEKSCVKLLEYEESHPFASLKGSDNIISFVTKRFPNGVIVRGAGAGAAVTAFGIFSDILKIHDMVSYSV
ncbi:hypothetical protein HK098_006102 [Nowakowskiella sp. JEL0407]|nr:hypothetical protein HK098_006102 [Nowakowskiella sp. JEL0407]